MNKKMVGAYSIRSILLTLLICLFPITYSQGDPVEKLMWNLESHKDVVRVQVPCVPEEIKYTRAVRALLTALRDGTKSIRESRSESLGDRGVPGRGTLVATLKDNSAFYIIAKEPPAPPAKEWYISQVKNYYGIKEGAISFRVLSEEIKDSKLCQGISSCRGKECGCKPLGSGITRGSGVYEELLWLFKGR